MPPLPTRMFEVSCSDLADHDFGACARQTGSTVVLGEPVSVITQAIGKLRELQAVPQGLPGGELLPESAIDRELLPEYSNLRRGSSFIGCCDMLRGSDPCLCCWKASPMFSGSVIPSASDDSRAKTQKRKSLASSKKPRA